MQVSKKIVDGEEDDRIGEERDFEDINDFTPSFGDHFECYTGDCIDGDGSSSISAKYCRQKSTGHRSMLLHIVKAFIIISLTFLSFVPSLAMGPTSKLSATSSGTSTTGFASSGTATSAALNSTKASSAAKEAEAAHSLALH